MKNYKLDKWIADKQVEETKFLAEKTVKLLEYFKEDLYKLAENASYRDFITLCSKLRDNALELANDAISARAKFKFIGDNFSELSEPATEDDIEDMRKTYGSAEVHIIDSVEALEEFVNKRKDSKDKVVSILSDVVEKLKNKKD